jgi:hypothetical protein
MREIHNKIIYNHFFFVPPIFIFGREGHLAYIHIYYLNLVCCAVLVTIECSLKRANCGDSYYYYYYFFPAGESYVDIFTYLSRKTCIFYFFVRKSNLV